MPVKLGARRVMPGVRRLSFVYQVKMNFSVDKGQA
jgi:hypothetical protein